MYEISSEINQIFIGLYRVDNSIPKSVPLIINGQETSTMIPIKIVINPEGGAHAC